MTKKMKKVAIVLAIVFFTALTLSSCSDHTCPAYSDNGSENVEANA